MLSLPQTPSTSAAVILDIALDNWSTFQQSFKILCFTKFGVAGQQILSNRALPLAPFANAPTKYDLDLDNAGIEIPGQYTYARRPATATEVALPGFDISALSLTESCPLVGLSVT